MNAVRVIAGWPSSWGAFPARRGGRQGEHEGRGDPCQGCRGTDSSETPLRTPEWTEMTRGLGHAQVPMPSQVLAARDPELVWLWPSQLPRNEFQRRLDAASKPLICEFIVIMS